MKNIKKRLSLNQSGVVLTMVMIVLLVMSIIISAVVFITVANLENSQKAASHTETYYVAEGGINYLTQSFETYYTTAPDTTSIEFFAAIDSYANTFPENNKQILPFSDNKGKTSQALMWITPLEVSNPEVHSYQLFSSGYIGNVHRTLSKIVSVSYTGGGLTFRDAIMSKGDMILGKAIIIGSISTNSTDEDSIVFKSGGGSVSAVYVPNNLPDGTLPVDIVNSTNPITGGASGIHQQDAPDIKNLDILSVPTTTEKLPKKVYTSGSNKYTLIDDSGNFMITSGSPSSSYTLSLLNQAYDLSTYPTETAFYVPRFIVRAELSTVAPNFVVNVGSNNYTIVTDTLWLSNTFKVTGTGKLTFIVKQNISSKTFDTNWPITASTNPVPIRINSSGIIGNVNPNESKMVIYVQTITTKGSPITLAFGSGSYYFSIFAENLKYTLDSITVHGAIGTNASGEAITLSTSNNSSAILLFAPNATVTLKSSSSAYNGAIICNKLTMDNPNAAVSPTINFDPVINGFIIPGVIDVGGLVSPPSITFIKSATQE